MGESSPPRASDEDNHDCRNPSTSPTYLESKVPSATATQLPNQASPDPQKQNSTVALVFTDASSSDSDEVSLDELDKLRRLSISSRDSNRQKAQEWPIGYASVMHEGVLRIRRDKYNESHRRDEASSLAVIRKGRTTQLYPFPESSNMDHKRIEKQSEEKDKIMPSHLVPFIPYIEKETDTTPGCNEWTKETFSLSQVIRKWLQMCDDLHLARCGKNAHSGAGPWSGPLWLIDVEDGCLVPTPPEARYVTLSYVWGGESASSCTTNETIGQLQQPNGLYGSTITLPRTILHAINLVRQVGERYLWCDRFCIIQDESVAKQCQLNAMGNIYAGAYFTLVAAQSDDASGGLYNEESMLRGCPQTSSPAMSSKQLFLDQAMHLMRTKWYSRSWTFQEFLFSKRRLIFHNDTVNWECLYSSWHKCQDMSRAKSITHLPSELLRKPSSDDAPWNGFESSPWPDMSRYARMVSLFNLRNLTYPEDILDAFAGVLSHLSRTFPGGFISGLPQMCFDAALAWQPWHHLERRKSIKRSISDAVLPSWSWVAWAGDMDSVSWRSAANYLLEPDDEEHPGQQCSWKTISTVKWKYSISRTSPHKEIRVHAQFSHPDLNSTSEPLPHGWSSRADPACSDQVLYYHSSDPSHPFRYPVPIRDRHIAHIPPISARYLHCTTAHALLKLGSAYQSSASDCPAVELTAEDGRWAGVLRLNCISRDSTTLIEEVETKNRGLVDLIEISAGSVQNQTLEEKSFDEWNREGCPRQKGIYEFLNVLWVEWVDGVAYRKALGRVVQDIWQEVATERIDVTLG